MKMLKIFFFDDCSFDLVTSNQVFEHVPDVVKCFQECRRVLKPGGILLFAVPLYDQAETQHVATLEGSVIRWLSPRSTTAVDQSALLDD
jgi:SAM-dependent methyltransferase